ncbi:hypothetical protein ACFY3M_30895 [Streptomyces mirabilis]|uniref:hypothetical protein n=1 Tax=Streptomyces mirabilis TaxID=68239 RepID=UPI0036A9C484
MSDTLLPEAFAELEPFAATWCLATEPERYERRLASDMTELQALYDVGFPRIEEALAYCDKFPLDALPDQARRLLELVHSIINGVDVRRNLAPAQGRRRRRRRDPPRRRTAALTRPGDRPSPADPPFTTTGTHTLRCRRERCTR